MNEDDKKVVEKGRGEKKGKGKKVCLRGKEKERKRSVFFLLDQKLMTLIRQKRGKIFAWYWRKQKGKEGEDDVYIYIKKKNLKRKRFRLAIQRDKKDLKC